MLHLILGGAAVYRCDNWLVSEWALAAEGETTAQKFFFRSLFIPLLTPQIPPCPAVSPVVNNPESKRKIRTLNPFSTMNQDRTQQSTPADASPIPLLLPRFPWKRETGATHPQSRRAQ